MRNDTRNGTKRNEAKFTKTKRNGTKRNVTERNNMKRNLYKRNETTPCLSLTYTEGFPKWANRGANVCSS